MKIFKAVILICLIYLTSAADDGFFPPGPPSDGNQTTTTIKPIPPTNSTTTTTTTSKPTPSPTNSTTTTTTSKPTTSSTTTTTEKPTTTSTAATTTTAKPTPTPKPLDPVGKWISNYTNTNRTCLILAGALDIDVNYKDGNATKNLTIHVPSNAKADGQCGNETSTTEKITLMWDTVNSVNLNFKRSNDSKKYDLQSVIIMLNVTASGNDSKFFFLAHNKTEFSTPVSNSYKCIQEQSLNLTDASRKGNYSGILRISHFQMQAFRNATNESFDEALDCATSETPDVVPIAVGCALAALVIIVLIAYLIGRRRSQARGYLSMFAQNKREEDYIPMKNLSCFN